MADAAAKQVAERRLSDAVVPDRARTPPQPLPMAGSAVTLRPLAVSTQAELADLARRLHAACDGPAGDGLWRWLPYGPFADAAALAAWLAVGSRCVDPLAFVLAAPGGASPGGMAAFLNIRPGDGVLELGHIWLVPAWQRSAAATEALSLMLRHAFDDLGYRRAEWKCDAGNAASRRAAERLGFRFEGIFHRHMVVKGRNRDTAWYAMIDEEWPAARAAFAAWLDPGNFDGDGRQRRTLAALRAEAEATGDGVSIAAAS